jgi:peptidoglycan hydrolase CwlO-like protein
MRSLQERERDALLGQQADLTSQIEVLRCQVDTLSQSNDARNAEIASLNEQLRASEEQLERQQERYVGLLVSLLLVVIEAHYAV